MNNDTISLADLIEHRQRSLGISDEQLAAALAYQPSVLRVIRTGAMRLPVNKVPALASALRVDLVQLLRAVLKEQSPGLWEVLQPLLPLGELAPAEVNLVRHIRKLAQGRPTAPVVLDGASVVAVVVAQ